MHSRIAFSFAAAISLSASVATFASCKSNQISVNNNADYESYVTQDATPGSDTTIDGPDRSQARIPAGALTQTTAITIARMKAGKYPDFPQGWVATGGIYSFEPHMQTFGKVVDIKVPYIDPGKSTRLVVSEPGGAWTPVDGAIIAGGFASTQSPHFSFYTVVTGAPPDPTLMDGGSDATIPDAAPDATPEAEAAPPLPPTIFLTSLTGVTRLFLDRANDAGLVDAAPALAQDGGFFALPNARKLAYGAPPSLLFVGQDPPDAGAITPFADPFGAMLQDGSVPLNTPEAMAVINGELWVANMSTMKLETYAPNGQMTWSGLPLQQIDAMAYNPATHTLYVVQAVPSLLYMFTVSGTGAGKTLTPLTGDAGTPLSTIPAANAIVVAPWNELLIGGSATVHHVSLAGTDLGAYANVTTMVTSGIGAVRWPNGIDELIVSDAETGTITRYWFDPSDTTHTTAIAGGTIPFGGIPSGMIVAP